MSVWLTNCSTATGACRHVKNTGAAAPLGAFPTTSAPACQHENARKSFAIKQMNGSCTEGEAGSKNAVLGRVPQNPVLNFTL